MNFGLSFEQQMIVDTVKTFVENELYQGQDVVVYTSRKIITGRDNEGALSIGRKI